MESTCPTEAELTELLVGDLPQSEREALEQHLETCAACRQRLDAMAAGDGMWLGEVRGYIKAGSPIRVRHVVERGESSTDSTVEIKVLAPDPFLSGREAPRRLGEYEILGELGRGGMGVVFKARQPKLQRDVALKVILAGQFASEAHLRRFHLEAEAVARLDHPNIVPIYEIGEREGRHFFSMKLIAGGSLKERRADFQAFPPASDGSTRDILGRQRNLARLMADIARAVHHAHQHGVLHRDLKPGNVLMDAQGKPHLTDFGLAKLTESETDLTLSRAVLGTPAYMSPEQAAGRTRLITTASDVYSLGAILYELLTGRPPFEADDAMLLLNRVVNEEPKTPRTFSPSVSRDLEIICLKCLEKEPSRRHHSAEILAEELERFARGEAIRSRPVSSPERVWRWCRRKPALAGALGGLVLVFILGFAGITWKWRAEIKQRQEVARQHRDFRQAVTRYLLGRAEIQLQEADSGMGLAYLAHLVRLDPSNHVVVERLMNALCYRNFCLPIAPLTHGQPIVPPSDPRHPERGRSAPGRPGRPKVPITTASFSPDGRLVVTASRDGTARLWDSGTGHPFGQPLTNSDAVLWAQFSPDGKMLVTTTRGGWVRIWDVRNQRLISSNGVFSGAVRYASFNPVGDKVVIACNEGLQPRPWGGAAWVVDVATGQVLGKELQHQNPVYYAAFSPDGRQVLTAEEHPPGGIYGGHLWDADTHLEIGHFQQGFRPETGNAFPRFSPSGDQVLAVDEEMTNGLLYSTTDIAAHAGAEHELHHGDRIGALAFSPDGRYVATGAFDATVKIWSSQTGTQAFQFQHEKPVTSVQFSPDGRFLLTGSADRMARLWPLNRENPVPTRIEPLRLETVVLGAVMTTNRIVTFSDARTAWLWDVPNSALPPVTLPRGAKESAGSELVRFCPPDGKIVASLDGHVVHRWNIRTGKPIGGLIRSRVGDQEILDMDFSPDGKYLATALNGGNVLLWDPRATNSDMKPLLPPFGKLSPRRDNSPPFGIRPPGRENAGRRGLPRAVRRVRFSPDSKRLVTACDDGSATVWNVISLRPRPVCTLLHDPGLRVNYAEFSPDGKRVVTASWDGTAIVWDANTGTKLLTLMNDSQVNWARFDPSGSRIVTASRQGTVSVWSARDGTLIYANQYADAVPESFPFDFGVVNGKTTLATIAGNTLQLYDLGTGKLLGAPIRHPAVLVSVRFSPDARRLVTTSSDDAAWLWDAASGEQLSERLQHSTNVTYAEFSPDGKQVVTSSKDGQVRLWPVIQAPNEAAPDWLPQLAEALAGERIGDNGVAEKVAVTNLWDLRRELQGKRSSAYRVLLLHLFSGRKGVSPP